MKIAIVGDKHAAYLQANYNKGIPGLPAWDIELKQIIEELLPQNFDRIYISPGFYLMGIKKADEAIEVSGTKDCFISCKKEERGFYSNSNWRSFIKNEADANMLWAAWKGAVKELYNLSDNIWLLPISLYWYELKIKEKIIKLYPSFCADFSRLINVAAILQGNKFYHKDRFGNLSKDGIEKINPLLRK